MIGMRNLFSRIRLAADDPFRDPNVRLLFSAEGISILGSQVSHIALPLIAVDVISASNGAIALLEAAFLLPFVFFSLPVGALLDRRTRRPVMVAMDLVRTAALLLIPLSYAISALSMPVLYLTLFIIGTATLIFDVAAQSYLPELLRGPRLATVNSRLMVIDSGASVVGPPIAGVIVGRFGGPIAVIIDSLSFLWSALLLRRLRHIETPPVVDAAAPTSRLRDEIREGLAWVLGHKHLRGNATAALFFNFFGAIANGAVIIAYGRRELFLPTELLGFILGAGVIGLLIGSFTAGRIAERIGVGRSIILGGFLLPTMPLGAVVGALIADSFGLRAALFAGALGIIVSPIPLLLSGISSVVRQPEHADE